MSFEILRFAQDDKKCLTLAAWEGDLKNGPGDPSPWLILHDPLVVILSVAKNLGDSAACKGCVVRYWEQLGSTKEGVSLTRQCHLRSFALLRMTKNA